MIAVGSLDAGVGFGMLRGARDFQIFKLSISKFANFQFFEVHFPINQNKCPNFTFSTFVARVLLSYSLLVAAGFDGGGGTVCSTTGAFESCEIVSSARHACLH